MLLLMLVVGQLARAEGTRQVAPSPVDSIVMLETNRPDFGNFASYGGPSDSRLVVSLADPAEVLFIGLSAEHNDSGRPFDLGRSRYRFRIVNASGTVVHGPFLIDNSNANVNSWSQALYGNYNTTATQNGSQIYRFAPGVEGDYYIEFTDVLSDGDNKVNIAFWDFTVTKDGQPIEGRIWSKNWAFRTPPRNTDFLPDCEWDRPFSGVLYSYTTDGFVSRIDFSNSGFQGLSFNVAFNSTGPGNSGNLERDRQSVPGFNATAFSAEHQIFLEEPDPLVFPSGECGGITPATTFSCTDGEGFCLEVSVTEAGQVEIVIDFNQNGMFDPESQDVSLVWNFPPDELTACVPWNGLRGDSTMVAFGDTVDLLFTYTRGVQHYAVYDAEFLKNGFCVETVRPICGQINDNRLFWDDRAILEDSGTGQPKDGRGGCECGTDNCRTWTNFNVNVENCADRQDALTTGYGDKNTLNTWWFGSSSLVTRADIPLLSCQIIGDTTLCEGTTTELTVQVSGSFDTFSYNWSGPNGFTSTSANTGTLSVAGEYCVTVTNPVGCQRVCCQEIIMADNPELSAIVTDATCNVSADGVIQANATGGSGNYLFSLNNGPFQDSGIFAGLVPGTYQIVVEDLQGCADSTEVTVGALAGVEMTVVITEATCDAATDGIIVATASGGSGNYQFSINGGPAQDSGTFTGLAPGTYEVIVEDEQGCSDTQEVQVGTLSSIVFDYPETLALCFGASVTVDFEGDPTGLTFSWEPATGIDDPTSAMPTFSPTATTTYTVTIRNAATPECFIQDQVEVVVGPDINPEVNGTLTTCEAETTLTATSDVTATFTWFDDMGAEIGTGASITLPVSGTASYVLRALDGAGCSQDAEFTVSGGPVNVNLPDTLAVCAGEELNLMVQNQDPNDTLTYNWTPAAAFAGGTDTANPDYIEVIGENTVFVDITNQFGCTYRDTVQVAVLDANASFDFTSMVQCDGATVVFNNTSTDAFGFLWRFGDGTTSTEANPTHVYNDPGTYTVQLTSVYAASCVTTKVAQVMVREPELIAGFSYELIDCSADSATIAFQDTSFNSFGNTTSWTWTFSDGQTSTVQNPTITFSGSGEITVTLTITSANGCEESETQTINIQLVDIDLPEQLDICPGESVTLNPSGNPDYIYSWAPATGLDDPTAASPVASPSETTVYTVTVLNIAGSDTCTVTDQVTVFVPQPINLDLGDDIITCGEDAVVTFTADVSVSIEWISANEGALGNDTFVVVNPLRRDTIFAIATDAAGCTERDTLVVIDQGVDITTDPLSPITTCSGQETTITIINQDQLDDLTYSWSPLDNIVSAIDEASVTVVVADGTFTFQAVVSNQFGCSDTISVDVTAVPFNPNLPDTIFVCAGTPTAINPDFTPGYSYSWSPAADLDDPNAPNPIFSGNLSTVYSVTVTDDSQTIPCEAVDSVVVFVYPALNLQTTGDTTVCEPLPGYVLTAQTDIPATITWYDDAGLTNVAGTGETLTVDIPAASGTYVFTAIATEGSNGCADTSSVTIVVNDITGSLPPDVVDVCADTPTPINPSGVDGLTYEWSPTTNLDLDTNGPHNPIFTGTDTTVYTLTVTDALGGCGVTKTVTVAVSPAINLEASGDTTLCEAVPVALAAVADMENITFLWYDNPELSGDPVAVGANVTVTPPTGSTTYTVVASNTVGCTETDSVVVVVMPILAEITPPQVFCEPVETATIMVTNLDPDVPLTYQWSPTDATDPDTGPIVTVNPNLAEEYSVTVTNEKGCELVLNTTVKVVDLSDLSISASHLDICLGESSVITVTGCEDCTYTWTGPGTITPPDGAEVTVTPNIDGEVEYTVLVERDGCSELLSVIIRVTELICTADYFFLPNAFTPNGDNVNDVLRMRSNFLEKITGFELQIYNRWGDLVFKTQNPQDGWDGTYKGKALPPDVYGFFMKVDCPSGEDVKKQGNVTLLK